MKKYFYQDFLHLNLKKITKRITSKCLYPYNALCWTCRNRRSTSLPLSGWSSGVLLTLSLKLMSAPLSNNSRATSVLQFHAAKCNGVYLLNRVCLFTWAPSCNRCLMVSVRLDIVARWRAVWPTSLLTSTGIPFRNIWSTVVTSPSIAAPRKLTKSCTSVSRYEKRLHAN